MKNFILILSLFSAILANEALAIYEGPLLEKAQGPGFTREEDGKGSKCEVYADRLVITKYVGTLSAYEARKLTMKDLEGLEKLINGASKGKIEGSNPGIADVPYTGYRAFKVLPNDDVQEVFLHEKIGSQDGKTNTAREARHLRNFLDQLCD